MLTDFNSFYSEQLGKAAFHDSYLLASTKAQFFLSSCLCQELLSLNKKNHCFGPLRGPITTFTVIFEPFWVPIVITNKIFMPILDLPKMQI